MAARLREIFTTALMIAFLLVSAGLEAQTEASIKGTVTDDDGSPIVGAKITITSSALPDYREEATSNKKGKFRLRVSAAASTYDLEFSKEGYAPLVVQAQPPAGGTSMVEAVMARGNAAGSRPDHGPAGSGSAGVAYNEGVDALEAGDLEIAVARLQEVIRIDPNVAVAHAFLARAYLEQGEYLQAAAAAETALELDPAETRALYMRYKAYRALDDEERAEEALDVLKGSGGAEGAAKRIFNEGAAAYGAGDMATAEAMFLIATEIDADLPEAYSALAEIYRLNGEHEQSLKMADKALELRPGDPGALRLRFNALFSLQRTDELRAAVDGLASADPEWSASRLPELALAAFNQNLMDAAVVLYEKSVDVDPSNARAHYNLGLCYFNLGDTANAGEAMKRFLELAPDDPDADAARSMLEYVD
jgi:tetratricopeptide (TPR) repeat protein